MSADLSCSELEGRTFEFISEGKLSPDLAPFDDSPAAACPTSNDGPDARTLCVFEPDNDLTPPPNPEWGGVDFGAELRQLFTNPDNYALCADLYAQEPFRSVVENMPELSDSQLEELRLASRFRRSYTCDLSADAPAVEPTAQPEFPPEFDVVQTRMFGAFANIASWNFCAQRRTFMGRETLGYFDPMKRISLYSSACRLESLYRVNTERLSPTHRGFLIAAHELGHALACFAGLEAGDAVEDVATLLGSFLATCHARLLKTYAECHIEAAGQIPPDRLAEHDAKFLNCRFRRWRAMELELDWLRKKLARKYSRLPKAAPEDTADCSGWAGPCLAFELD